MNRLICTAQSKLALFKLYQHWMRQWCFLCSYACWKLQLPRQHGMLVVAFRMRWGVGICDTNFSHGGRCATWRNSRVCFAVHHICPRCAFAATHLCKLRFLLHFCFALITFLSKRPSFSLFHKPLPRVRSVRPESCPSEAPTCNLISTTKGRYHLRYQTVRR